MKAKTPSESAILNTEIILPNDTNPLGYLLGGKLMYWMDIAAAICAQAHSGNVAVTVAVDRITFNAPGKTGEVVQIKAVPLRAFHTSLEIYVSVWKKDMKTGEHHPMNEAWFTFVALDKTGKPTAVPEVLPETVEEKEMWKRSGERKAIRDEENS